ncbi:MAG TPA: hypothetical protein VGM01_00345 [Ktedonobacteraceae bacterium]
MSNEQALLNCTFGWGKTCRLYYDSLEIAGKSYNLRDLTSIQPSYRTVFGVSSARLELSFGLNRLVLRGIGDLDIARLMVSHLQPYCSTTHLAAYKGSRTSRSRKLARAQAKAWERTNKLPAILDIPEASSPKTGASDTLKCARAADNESGFAEEPPTDKPLSLDAIPKAPIEDTSLTPSETLEAFAQLANNLSTYASPLPTTLWQPPHTPRFQPPLHSVHLIPPNQKFDSNSIPVPAIKASVLPIIHVPVRLQHGECAHYSIGATLCSDRISNSEYATYPLLDQGLLVLTNRRVLYIGKRCRFTLAYTHLWYVSLLHTAVALHIEGQFRRIIIELEHPHEWASRIELLAFIARRARPRPETPTIAVAAIPGLNMTLKRKAIKPLAKGKAVSDNTTIPLSNGRIVESRIVEAETIEFNDEAIPACADHETLDFPSNPATEAMESKESSQPESAEQSTRTDMTARPISQAPQLEDAPTREFPAKPDVANMATQEFSLDSLQLEEDIMLQQGSDIANIATQEFSLDSLQPENNQGLADKTTQDLLVDQAEIARFQTTQQSEEQLEITTSELYDPALPRNESEPEESDTPSTQELDDDDDCTIHLHDRKLSQLRTVEMSEPVSDRLPDIEPVKRRPLRVRVRPRPL